MCSRIISLSRFWIAHNKGTFLPVGRYSCHLSCLPVVSMQQIMPVTCLPLSQQFLYLLSGHAKRFLDNWFFFFFFHNFLHFGDKTLGTKTLFYSLDTSLSGHRCSFVKLYSEAQRMVGNKKGKEQRYIICINSMVLFFVFQTYLSLFVCLFVSIAHKQSSENKLSLVYLNTT